VDIVRERQKAREEAKAVEAKANVVADDEDYERLYANHALKMPGFNDYRRKTSRRIPVIRLERLGSGEKA